MLHLQIDLNTDLKSKLRKEALANGMDVVTFVALAVQEKLAATMDDTDAVGAFNTDDWIRNFVEWVADHPQVPRLNTRRENIYGDGESDREGSASE